MRSLSAMMGNFRLLPEISLMSLIHPPWLSTVFADSPMSFTPRLVNSGSSFAKAPSSDKWASQLEHSVQWILSALTSSAHWSVVFRMAEENYPVVADEFVEVDRAICGISLEIGSNRSKAQSGGALLANSMRFRWGQGIDAGCCSRLWSLFLRTHVDF